MPEAHDDFPQASLEPRRRTRISTVWLIPILAAVIALGIAVERILSEGPTITIVFSAASGIEPGKTLIRYKDVTIGQVTDVQLSDDYDKVKVTAKIAKSAAGLMVEDARFWVVEPRVTLQGVTGLSTLLSGNYIGFAQGKSSERARHFDGLAVAPVLTGNEPGREFKLRAAQGGGLVSGLSVYYRQFPVGEVIGVDLDPDGQATTVRIFVRAPYDKYVNTQTRFWNASGVDLSINANGLQLRTEALASVLVGGIAFQEAPDYPAGAQAAPNQVFTLYSTREQAMREPDAGVERYVMRFTQSVRGLSVGAPVEFRGVVVGEVTRIALEFDPKTFEFSQPVEINFYPARLAARAYDRKTMPPAPKTEAERMAGMARFIEKGLRGQLRTGSLLTGQAFIAIDMFPDAPRAKVNVAQRPLEIPVVPGPFDNLETNIASIVKKLDKVEYQAIGADLRKTLATLTEALETTNTALKRIDAETVPELNAALKDLRQTLKSADALLASGSPAETELRQALREVARAAASIRNLADYLERQPQSIIRGKPAQEANP